MALTGTETEAKPSGAAIDGTLDAFSGTSTGEAFFSKKKEDEDNAMFTVS